jgi:hypothetical protein
MPARIYKEVRYRDSLAHAKDSAYLLAKGYIKIIKDTLNLDDEDDAEAIDKLKQAKQKDTLKKPQPSNNDTNQTVPSTTKATLPDRKKAADIKNSAK